MMDSDSSVEASTSMITMVYRVVCGDHPEQKAPTAVANFIDIGPIL